MQFNNIETVALSKLEAAIKAEAKKARDAVEAGEAQIDMVVRIKGLVKVGNDHEAIINASVPWEGIAIEALQKLNEQTQRAILADVLDGKVTNQAEITKEFIVTFVRAAKGTKRQIRKGAVKLMDFIIEKLA